MRTLLLCFLTLSSFYLSAQSPILFIFDASGSMWGPLDAEYKIDIARDVLAASIEPLPETQGLGLITYGHRKKGDCRDVELMLQLENKSKNAITNALKNIKPLGKTPLAYSARLAIDQLREKNIKATIILITDGIESCDGDLCEVVRKAKAEGIDFRMHIVGFGLKEGETKNLECAANAGNGQYYDASDANALSDVLNEATQATVDQPAPNYSVYATKNGEGIDAYIKVFSEEGSPLNIAARTYRDTAFFYLPSGTYHLEVHPLENTDIESIKLAGVQSNKDEITHQTVRFDGGKLSLSTLNNGEGCDASVRIYKSGSTKIAASGRTYGRTTVFELNPGIYDISVDALKLKGLSKKAKIENVEIKAAAENKQEYRFESGIALIGAKSSTELIDAVVKVKDAETNEVVASNRTYTSAANNPKQFILTPGTYKVSLKCLGKYKGQETEFEITIKAGETEERISTF